MRSSSLVIGLVLLVGACGGTAVIDPGSGSGGSGGQSSTGNGSGGANTTSGPTSGPGSGVTTGPTTTTTGNDCGSLAARLTNALADAQSCNSCDNGPDPCAYFSGQQLTDTCGCPMPVNMDNMQDVARALEAFQAWTAAGCVPLDCDQPCAVSNDPRCTPSGAMCQGFCAP